MKKIDTENFLIQQKEAEKQHKLLVQRMCGKSRRELKPIIFAITYGAGASRKLAEVLLEE